MAVSYNWHRQKVDFSKHFGHKRHCSLQDDPKKLSVKYVNKRCSPNRLNSGNRLACDQNTITITVKKKTNIEQKKQNFLKENKRTKRSIAPSLITIDDHLKVLAKKCSTPDVLQTNVHRNQKRRCSDTCLNTSTTFKTKKIVNTVSLDPKKIPPVCKHLLNHPLMQAQLSIYRCQPKKEKETGCRTCTSAAIFEVVKCLYDCYKKKKCDPCKCVVCGYLPKDIRKLINQVGKSIANVGVETPSTDRKTRATMTSKENELISMLQNEPKPEKPKISASEKLRIAKAFGILTPEAPGCIKVDMDPNHKDYFTEYMTKVDAPYPDDHTPLEKMLYRTQVPEEGPSVRVPSKKLRKARASGLLTPLDGKTQEQKERMLRNLAMNNIPLPEGKTESEKILIAKVRRGVGLPPGPKTAAEKEKYAKAQVAGLITPLKGKSQPQKENILRSLLEIGIPLPEGRTPAEKALIEKVEIDCLSKVMFRIDTEKSIKNRARSYVQTLFNKFATETGYMVLVETSCVKDTFHNLQVKGLLTQIEGKAKEEVIKPHSIRPTETKSLEKALFKEGVRLVPESQGKTQTEKLLRGTEKECVRLRDDQISSKKIIIKQLHSTKLLEERITKLREKLLPCLAVAGNPYSKSKTSLENLLGRILKDKAKAFNNISEEILKSKSSKSESEQTKVDKRSADARPTVPEDYVPPKTENVNELQDTSKICEKYDVGTAIPRKVSKGMVTNLVTHIKEVFNNKLVSATMCKRSDVNKLSYRNSYLTIQLSLSDISNATTQNETRSAFTDTKDIKETRDKATSLASIINLAASDKIDTLDVIPTKEIKKRKNNINSTNGKGQISSDTSTEDIDSKSTIYSLFKNDDTNNASQSHDNTYERDFEENNADLIYIYKPNLELDRKEKLAASSRIILTDSYNITPTTSGSLYLIETGSTTSCDSAMTDFSCATRGTSDTETATDVFYMQKSEEHLQDTSPEPRIFWFYRNKVIHNVPGKDVKIYLVSEVKMRQERNEPAQRTKNQLELNDHWNSSHCRLEATQTASRRSLRSSSSIFIVISPSNHGEMSSGELGSLIYIEKLDSVSKLKTIKLVPHENTDPIRMCGRHTRNEEKSSVDPRAEFKRSEIRPEPLGHTSHALPVTNGSTRYTCKKGTNNRENRLEYPAEPIQRPRIPPKYSENLKMMAGRATWNKELHLKPSSCSATCRLSPRSPERVGCSGKQRMGPKNLEINLDKTRRVSGSKAPTCKPITRYFYCDENTIYREQQNQWVPDQRFVAKSSKVCLISTTHSSRCRVHSKVSFPDELKYIKRDKSSEPSKKKCLGPDPKKCPPKRPKERNNTDDDSSSCSYDEKAKRKREKRPQLTIKGSQKGSSKCNLRSPKSDKGSKVRFDHLLRSCCPCESPRKELRPCVNDKKGPHQRDCYCSKKESKPYSGEKIKLEPYGSEKKESKPCDEKKNEPEPCHSEEKGSEPCDTEKQESEPCDSEVKESKPCDFTREKISETFEKVKKKISSESTTCATATKVRPCEDKKKKDPGMCSLQPSTDKQYNQSKERSSQGRETVKRATSPLNVKVISIRIDGSATCKPTEQSPAVCSEKENIPKKCRSDPCGPDCSDDIKNESEIPTKDAADKLMASEYQPSDDNSKFSQHKTSESHANSTQDSTKPSTAECIKQQMVKEQWFPQKSSPTKQLTGECVKIHEQMASECSENSTHDSIKHPADEVVKLSQQSAAECPEAMTPSSTEQRANESAELRQQMASECQGKSTQDSIQQPAETVKCIQQILMTSECPADSTQDSISKPVDEDVELSQQMAAECPAKSNQDSTELPADELSQQISSEVPSTLNGDLTEQAECAKQQMVSEQCLPPKPTQDSDLPVPIPVKEKKKNNKRSIFPHASKGSECIPESQETVQRYNNTDPAESTPTPSTHGKIIQDSDKKYGRLWWCKKKRRVIFRRHSRPPAPPPPRLVEEQTAETQCERDVRDLAQMTDNLEQMTDSLREMARGLTLCNCGDIVKPCQCLQELITQSMTSRHVTKTKTTSKCECPPPILIIKGQTATEQNKKQVDNLRQMIDQQLGCSCMDYLDKHTINPCKCLAKLEQAQIMTSPHVSKQNACKCPPMQIAQLNCECLQPTATSQDEADGTQGITSDHGGKKKFACRCSQPTAAGQMATGQNSQDGTCPGMASGQGGKKNTTEQTAAVQCQKESQPKRDTLDPSQGKQTQEQNNTKHVKKTVIRESPSKDRFKLSCPVDEKPTGSKDQKTGGKKKKLSISLRKKKHPPAEHSSSDEGMECQNKNSSRVKWCQKKYVISECPPLPMEDPCDASCSSPERKKQQKKNAKNQAKIKTGDKKIDTSCTHGAAACLCKNDPLFLKNKKHKCECPCPSYVEEVDLNHNMKDCAPAPPCPQKDSKETKIEKTGSAECDQGQMTEGKIDKSSYTDRPIKGLCKTKNKATGRGKWGKKKKECICLPEPPTTDTGCDPPCVKEQWKMRSRETHSRSGFSVKKKPAPRVDHTMCFEDALAYFEEHPEDDPMRKKKKKVICECPTLQCRESYGSDTLKFCYAGS